MSSLKTICFIASDTEPAQETRQKLAAKYGNVPCEEADVVVALGGDGTMLEVLHGHHAFDKPVYGMNFGSVGFLLNPYREEDLLDRLNAAQKVSLYPLQMTTHDCDGNETEAIAFNEVSLFRQRRQTAHLKITVDGVERMPELVCDGVLIATPAGSTAYNLSARGPILPLDSNILALTPISAFRPRRWNGALLPSRSEIKIDVIDNEKRPVSTTADFTEVRNVCNVKISQSKDIFVDILFDPDHHLEERIIKEQFLN